MSDGTDAMVGAMIGSSIASDNSAQLQAMAIHQRAQSISDMYGIRPAELDEYRKQPGRGPKYGKMLLAAAAGAAVVLGGIALFATGGLAAFAATPLVLGGLAGAAVGGMLSNVSDYNRDVKDYQNYMNDFASHARSQHEAKLRQQTIEAVQDAQQGGSKQWASDIAAQREQMAMQKNSVG